VTTMSELAWRGAAPPERKVLAGETVVLEPLDAARHGDDLYAAAEGADESWRYLPYGPFGSKDEFMRWLPRHASTADPLAFAIIDRATGLALGITTLMSIVPEHGVIEIGHIWLSPRLQRTRQATEAIFIQARYAFDVLGNRRLEWKCDAANAPSRRAAGRYGFSFEGVFRNHRVIKGRNRDTAWFSITDAEWPAARAAFEAWLDAGNFDAEGRQKRSLSEIREGIEPEAVR
jgi:RimJ/RimL family protein N-acetyltransferase